MTYNKTISPIEGGENGNGAQKPAVRKKKANKGKIISAVCTYAVFVLYALWVLVPFFVVLITSVTPQEEYLETMKFIWMPKHLDFSAYRTVFVDNIYTPFYQAFLNTMWQVVPTTLVGLFVSGLSAYSFAKIPFKGKGAMFMGLVATMMIPGAVLTIPSYLFYDAIGWANGVLPLLIPGLFGAAGVTFFLRQFFCGLPDELMEAARIDGLNDFMIYVRIVLPLTAPAFIAQGVFMFIGGYNSYQAPLLYLMNYPELKPLALALADFQNGQAQTQAEVCASVIIALFPLLVLYCFLQKYFTQGIAMTGLKA